MTVNRTTLLDLPLPVTGTESGTWGDTTNNGLTQYMDIAIAGMSNLTSANFTAGALTIETTEGDSSATNISATSAQYAGFRVSSLAVNSTITVGNTGTSPARSYRLINADATYSLTFKATGQTGVTLLPGQSAVVAFNGTDYVIIGVVGAGSTTDNTVPRFDGTTGEILQSSGVTIDDSNNVSGVAQLNITTLDATNIEVTNIKAKDGTAAASIADSTGVVSITANPVLSGGTANGVLYLDGSKVATSGSALQFNGTNFYTTAQVIGGAGSTVANFIARSTVSNGGAGFSQFLFGNANSDTRGYLSYSHASEAILFGTSGSEQMRLTSTGLGIGTSSPAYKLDVRGGVITAGNGTIFGGISYSTRPEIGAISNHPVGFITNNTTQMLLDTSGNLGIGTSSPSSTLQVGGGSGLKQAVVSGGGYDLVLGASGGPIFGYSSQAISTVFNTASVPLGIGTNASQPLIFGTSATERARITSGGNFKIGGTADRGTTEGDKQLVLFDGTAPVGTLTNGVSFYSASGEARVMDAAGNSTLLSPHDSKTNEWIFHSKHTPTGKVLRIDVERLLKFVNDHFGLDAVQEFIEP